MLLRSFEQQLSAEERAGSDAALAGSEELRREQQQLEKVRHWLGSLQATPKNGFVDGVKELNTRRSRLRSYRFCPRAAAACLIVLLLNPHRNLYGGRQPVYRRYHWREQPGAGGCLFLSGILKKNANIKKIVAAVLSPYWVGFVAGFSPIAT